MKSLRQRIQILIAGCFTLAAIATAGAASAASLSVGSAQASPGDQGVRIRVDLASGGGEEIASFQMDLLYDRQRLDFVAAQVGSAANDAGKDVSYQAREDGSVRFIVFGLNENVIGDGNVLELTFDVKETAEAGNAELSLENLMASSPDRLQVPLTAQDGHIEILGASDTTPPRISGVQVGDVTQTSATISWNTDEPATSQILYGTSTSYGHATSLDSGLTTSHQQTISGLSAGTTYHFKVVSRDEAGNEASSSDQTFATAAPNDDPPTVEITQPSGGSTVSGSVTVTASASDDHGIARVEFYVDGSKKKTDTQSPYAFEWDTTGVANGAHTLMAKAVDTGDHESTDQISVNVENQQPDDPPTVEITQPSGGSTVSGSVTVTASASDDHGIARVEFYVDGDKKKTDTQSPYAFEWDTTGVANGAHTLMAKAFDSEGQSGSHQVQITVRNIQPEPTEATLTVGSGQASAGDQGVEIDVELANGSEGIAAIQMDLYFDHQRLDFAGAQAGSAASAAGKELSHQIKGDGIVRLVVFGLNENAIGDGQLLRLTFDVKGSASAGKANIELQNVKASSLDGGSIVPTTVQNGYIDVSGSSDTTPPQISGIRVSDITTNGATISWTTDEPSTGKVLYGKTAAYGQSTAMDSATTSHQQSLSGLDPGTTYHFAVVSKDAAGNASQSADQTFATAAPSDDPPTVQITRPADGAKVSGTVSIEAAASDDHGVTAVEFYVDGVKKATDTTNDYAYSWDTTTVSNGVHVLMARALDTAGNHASAQIQVNVDNGQDTTPLWIQTTSPKDGATVSGKVKWTADAGGSARILSVSFFVDGDLKKTDRLAPWRCVLNTTAYDNAEHVLMVKAVDATGAEATHQVTVTVENGDGSGDGSGQKPSSLGKLEDFVLFAAKRLTLRAYANSTGNIGSNGRIVIQQGAPSTITGSVLAMGSIVIQSGNTIDGDVISRRRVLIDEGATVTGEVQGNAKVRPLTMPYLGDAAQSITPSRPTNRITWENIENWRTKVTTSTRSKGWNPAFPAGLTDQAKGVNVAQGETKALSPGSYGAVSVGDGAVLTLSGGEYRFESLKLSRMASVTIDLADGPVVIHVSYRLMLGQNAQIGIVPESGSIEDITVNVTSPNTIRIGDGASFRGVLIAPYARVKCYPGSSIEGAVYADKIFLGEGAGFYPAP